MNPDMNNHIYTSMIYALGQDMTTRHEKCEDKTYSRCSFQPISTLYLFYYIEILPKRNAGLHIS